MEKGNGSFFWVEEHNEQLPSPVKHRRKVKPKKVEFVGWGSKLLIEFLQSIGKDTGKQLSQYDVTAIINDYVNTFKLLNPIKKKRVDCDERLRSLFGKKSIPRIKIHDLLYSHFAENNDSSEDDHLYSSEEYEDINVSCKKQKVSSLEKKAPSQKKKAETHLSCFAAIIPENIKLLYLKRSLVQEFVKHPESFEEKLVGSYIRIKTDPMDFSQKNSHQLHPVTGVKNVRVNGDVHEEVLLQAPNMIKDIPICMLSDDDFSKEECEDLCQRVKDGLLKRPTVVEFEHKTQILHEDITKHWIPRELAYLQNLIDRANEKGWRKELFEYLEKRKLLQTPSEQSKLLTEVPKVIADALEPEATPQEQIQEDIEELNTSITIQKDVSHLTLDSVKDQALPTHDLDAAEDVVVIVEVNESNAKPMEKAPLKSFEWVETKQVLKTKSLGQTLDLNSTQNVIELSDDDEDEDEYTTQKQQNEYDFSRPKWFYRDPQGQIQGPVSRNELKLWSDAGYFLPDFKVWEGGQTPDRAILLKDMLSSS